MNSTTRAAIAGGPARTRGRTQPGICRRVLCVGVDPGQLTAANKAALGRRLSGGNVEPVPSRGATGQFAGVLVADGHLAPTGGHIGSLRWRYNADGSITPVRG